MLHLQAGRDPHVITRQCHDQEEAERWAVELIQRGFTPVIIDGSWFDPQASWQAPRPGTPTGFQAVGHGRLTCRPYMLGHPLTKG